MKLAGNSNSIFLRANRTANAKSLAIDTLRLDPGRVSAADKVADRIIQLLDQDGERSVKSIVRELNAGVGDTLAAVEKLKEFGLIRVEEATGETLISKTPD